MPEIKRRVMEPYWTTTDGKTVRLYHGHVNDVLRSLPTGSIHCVVTSPPYWGLRDYGTGTWEGGDPACDHKVVNGSKAQSRSTLGFSNGGTATRLSPDNQAFLSGDRYAKNKCPRCGARRIDQQLGSEPSPDCGCFRSPVLETLLRPNLTDTQRAKALELAHQLSAYLSPREPCGRCFVCSMVGVFREVRRVLRDDGTLWLNLGDSYSGGGRGDAGGQGTSSEKQISNVGTAIRSRQKMSLPSGNLVGVPWRVALALQADGWVLRQDIIWAKPSPMPESVRNRCTKAHEYVFLLTKKMGYYYDAEAIKEAAREKYFGRYNSAFNTGIKESSGAGRPRGGANTAGIKPVNTYSNKRSVWTVASQGYPGAHFATFPPALITPMIKAGTSEKGCCAGCGAPWRRVVSEASGGSKGASWHSHDADQVKGNFKTVSSSGYKPGETIGWEPTCECHGKILWEKVKVDKSAARVPGGDRNSDGDCGASPRDEGETVRRVARYVSDVPLDDHSVVPCTVLDPFCGSGTTPAVCIGLGRYSIGIDLSEQYLGANAIPRIQEACLASPDHRGIAGKNQKGPVGRKLTIKDLTKK